MMVRIYAPEDEVSQQMAAEIREMILNSLVPCAEEDIEIVPSEGTAVYVNSYSQNKEYTVSIRKLLQPKYGRSVQVTGVPAV